MFLDEILIVMTSAEHGGRGYIEGTLKVNGVPSARRIFLADRRLQKVVATTFSATNGAFRFDGLNPEIEFDLRAQDWARARRDDIVSAVKPEPYPA